LPAAGRPGGVQVGDDGAENVLLVVEVAVESGGRDARVASDLGDPRAPVAEGGEPFLRPRQDAGAGRGIERRSHGGRRFHEVNNWSDFSLLSRGEAGDTRRSLPPGGPNGAERR